MEAHLQRKYSNVAFEGNRPGCMWGIFHIFHFPQRVYTRKPLPEKKQRGGRQAGGVKIAGVAGEGHDNDGNIENTKKVTNPTRKKSRKIPIKTLIAKEMSKEREQKQGIRALPGRLTRTDSIHYLDCTDYDLDGRTTICENPAFELQSHEKSTCDGGTHNHLLPEFSGEQIISNEGCEVCGTLNGSTDYLNPKKTDDIRNQLDEKQALLQEMADETNEALLKQKFMNGNGLRRDVSLYPSKELLDVIDVFNENRVLFLKILEDPNSILAKHLRGNSNPEAVLTKCGSFQAAEFSGRSAGSLIKLKEKLQEMQFYTKQEGKLEDGTTIATLGENGYSKSLPMKAAEIAEAGTSLKSVPNSLDGLKRRKENGKVLNRFKDIKQRIKDAFKEGKKERLRISMDGILHRIPYGWKASKNVKADACKDGRDSPINCYNSDSVIPARTKSVPIRIRRTPSLTKSLERYSQLLESISSKDTERNFSERLKLINEKGDDRHSSRPFQRILSMPDNGSYFLGRYKDSDLPHDMLHRRTPSRVLADSNADVESCSPDNQKPADTVINTEKCTQLDHFVETESQVNYVENIGGSLDGDQGILVSDADGYLSDKEIGIGKDATMEEDRDLLHGQETGSTKNASDEQRQASPTSVLYSCSPEDIMSPTGATVTKGDSEMKPRHINFNEQDHLVNLQDQCSMDAPSLVTEENNDDIKTPSSHAESDVLHAEVDREDDVDFNYVRDVLQKSGFSVDELLGTWHSPEQPVDPSLIYEVESSPHGFDIGTEAGSSCEHQLLFDLINEVLLEIYDGSHAYCPWHLCSNSSIRPMPVGNHVLEEVWAGISWHLSSQPHLHRSLEYIVARDLAKNGGWMHLHAEAECVGLDLEEWIIDDLLDEVAYELAGTHLH